MRTSLGECGRRPRHRPRRRPLVADLQLAQPLPQLVALLLAFFLSATTTLRYTTDHVYIATIAITIVE